MTPCGIALMALVHLFGLKPQTLRALPDPAQAPDPSPGFSQIDKEQEGGGQKENGKEVLSCQYCTLGLDRVNEWAVKL